MDHTAYRFFGALLVLWKCFYRQYMRAKSAEISTTVGQFGRQLVKPMLCLEVLYMKPPAKSGNICWIVGHVFCNFSPDCVTMVCSWSLCGEKQVQVLTEADIQSSSWPICCL